MPQKLRVNAAVSVWQSDISVHTTFSNSHGYLILYVVHDKISTLYQKLSINKVLHLSLQGFNPKLLIFTLFYETALGQSLEQVNSETLFMEAVIFQVLNGKLVFSFLMVSIQTCHLLSKSITNLNKMKGVIRFNLTIFKT